jgi:adenosylcobinamide-phosphate synthase
MGLPGFFALIMALLLEQVRPLQSDNFVHRSARAVAGALEQNFNAGERQQGVLAWLVYVVPVTLAAWLIGALCSHLHFLLGIAWDIVVLYLTLGFRQFSHFYTDILVALANNDLQEARRILADWKRRTDPDFSAAELDLSNLSRLAIEEALVASHRHVFGVFFWFVLCPGPSGAVLYRLADYLARAWNQPEVLRGEPFGGFALKAFTVIDWIPVRMTAIGFAIVGNFEDAVFSWRNHSAQWKEPFRGILLAAGAGALGVRLGDAQSLGSSFSNDPESDETAMGGVEASPAAMRSAIGLVWRSVLLWMLLLLLLSVSGLLG